MSFHDRRKPYLTSTVDTFAQYREKPLVSFHESQKHYSTTSVIAPKHINGVNGNLLYSEGPKADLTTPVKDTAIFRENSPMSFHERQKYYSTTSVKTLAYYREKLSFIKRRKYYSTTPVHAPKLGNLSFSERSKAGLTALVKSERSHENFSYSEEPKAALTTLVKAEQFHENLSYLERPRTDLTTLVKGANIMAPMKKSLKVEVKTEL